MENIKYIVLDMDGTALNENGVFSDNLLTKLLEMQKNGYKVIICSGRSLQMLQKEMKQLELPKYEGYIVGNNGGDIHGFKNGEEITHKESEFTLEEVEEIIATIKDDVDLIVTYHDNSISGSKPAWQIDRTVKNTGLDFDYDYVHATPKMLLYYKEGFTNEDDKMIREKLINLNSDINVFSSFPGALEVTPKGATKGGGLNYLVDNFDIENKELLCFGDEENDQSMFEYCENSVAMGNANPIIKELATYQTVTNREDGVYKFLEENFSKQ